MEATTFAVVYVAWPYQLFVSIGASELDDSGEEKLSGGREDELTALDEEERTELEDSPFPRDSLFTELEDTELEDFF